LGGSDDPVVGMRGREGREERTYSTASGVLCEASCGRLAVLFHVAMFKSYALYVKKIVGT